MNKQLMAANRAGYEARQRKISIDSCPYRDIRTTTGKVTYSRSFKNAWIAGYEACRNDEYHGDYDGWSEERMEVTND